MERFKSLLYWQHLAIDTIITQGVWWGLSKMIHTPVLIQSIIAGLVLVATIFAVAWYLPKLSPKISTDDKSGLTVTTPIRDWIDISAWLVHKKDVADAIAYDVVYGDAVVGVVKSEKDHRVITLTTDIFFESKTPTLSQEEWERLDGQIASSLAQKDFQFSIPQPQHVQIIRQVYIPIDELQFRERIMDVFRARIPIIEMWKEAHRRSDSDKGDSQP